MIMSLSDLSPLLLNYSILLYKSPFPYFPINLFPCIFWYVSPYHRWLWSGMNFILVPISYLKSPLHKKYWTGYYGKYKFQQELSYYRDQIIFSTLLSTASLMYTVVTSLLNPFIYSLRNKDLKRALKILFGKKYIKESIFLGLKKCPW